MHPTCMQLCQFIFLSEKDQERFQFVRTMSSTILLCLHDNRKLCIGITSTNLYTDILSPSLNIRSDERDMSALQTDYSNHDDDFESITRIVDTSSLLQCPICKKEIQDPRILCSNGHTFCHNCLKVNLLLFLSHLLFIISFGRMFCQQTVF